METSRSTGRLARRLAASFAVVLFSFGLFGGEASAWGSFVRTETWGCQWQARSLSSSSYSETVKLSSGSCSEMHARLRTSSGGGSTWAVHPDHAWIQISNPAYVGGQHRVCGGCAIHFT